MEQDEDEEQLTIELIAPFGGTKVIGGQNKLIKILARAMCDCTGGFTVASKRSAN